MSIVVTCPSCSANIKAPDAAAGKRVKCPKCTSTIEVPAPQPPPAFDDFTDEPPPPMPVRGSAVQSREIGEPTNFPPPPADWESNRQIVGLLAIMMGAFGIHKFVLGKNIPALITLLVSLFTFGIGWAVMFVVGVVEGIRYLRMSNAEFYQTYVVGKKDWL